MKIFYLGQQMIMRPVQVEYPILKNIGIRKYRSEYVSFSNRLPKRYWGKDFIKQISEYNFVELVEIAGFSTYYFDILLYSYSIP